MIALLVHIGIPKREDTFGWNMGVILPISTCNSLTEELKIHRNGILCKRTYMSKVFAGANVTSRLVTINNITGFYQMLIMLNLLLFGCFTVRQHVDGCFSFMPCIIYKRRMHSQDMRLDFLVYVLLWTRRRCVQFFSFLIVSFICMSRNWSFNPACNPY